MAVRPDPLPHWATIAYGPDEMAWEEAKRQCRVVLYEWARAGQPRTYSELVKRVTAIRWPQWQARSGQLGFLLGQVALEELSIDEDRPIISAMAYGQSDNAPGSGFWALCSDLDLGVGSSRAERDRFWDSEWRACVSFYGRRSPTAESQP